MVDSIGLGTASSDYKNEMLTPFFQSHETCVNILSWLQPQFWGLVQFGCLACNCKRLLTASIMTTTIESARLANHTR